MARFLRVLFLRALGGATRLARQSCPPAPTSSRTKKRTTNRVWSAFSIWLWGTPTSWWSPFWWRKEENKWRRMGG